MSNTPPPPPSRPQNHSGYAHHVSTLPTDPPDKWHTAPQGVYECEGYREKTRANDHEVTRTYFVPWSSLAAFREWAIGYPTSVFYLTAGGEFWDNVNWDDNVLVPNSSKMSRVLPLQDPVRPWLFASEVECMETMGAAILDRSNYAIGANGLPLSSETLLPTIAFVDNSAGGAYAFGTHQPDPGQTGYPSTTPAAGQSTDFWVDLLPGETSVDGQSRKYTAPTLNYRDGGTKCRVVFRPRQYELLTDAEAERVSASNAVPVELTRFVLREEQYANEAIPLSRIASTLLTFAEDPVRGVAIPESGVMHLPSAQLSYTWYDVPDRPLSAYAACLGKVNKSEFDGLGGSPKYPAETLLCMPWQTKRRVSCTGRVTWDITYRFLFRPSKWNRYPYSTANGQFGFALATFDGTSTGRKVYGEANFHQLFFLPPPTDYLGTQS